MSSYTYFLCEPGELEELPEILSNRAVRKGKVDSCQFCVVEGIAEDEFKGDFIVTVKKLERGYKFRYGRYIFKNRTLIVDPDPDKVDELLYEKLPVLFCYRKRCDVLVEKCIGVAASLSEFESGVLKKISSVSSIAVRADVADLERLMDEMSEWHSMFFSRFMEFKELNERLFEAMARYERICRDLQLRAKSYEEVRALEYYESKFEQTLNGLRDLFSLMSLRLDTLRNREYLDLHRKTSSLQIAATVIEFVAVYYYTMKIWEHFSAEKLPRAVEFLLLFAFTVLVILLTDVVGEYIRTGKVGFKGVAVITALVTVVAAMFCLALGF